MKKKKNLGLENLFGKEFKNLINEIESNKTNESIIEMEISNIKPNPFQPRKTFNKKSLNELANSIKENGLISPISILKRDEEYIIISGERRYRAHQILGLKKIKSIIVNVPIEKIEELAIIENIQRKQLDPIEEAIALKSLSMNRRMSHQQISQTLGKSRSYVTNSLRLLTLDEKIIKEVQTNNLTVGQIKPLVGLEKNKQIEILELILKDGLNSREVEQVIKKIKSKKKENFDFNELVVKNKRNKIKVSNKKVSISFSDEKELVNILKKINAFNEEKE